VGVSAIGLPRATFLACGQAAAGTHRSPTLRGCERRGAVLTTCARANKPTGYTTAMGRAQGAQNPAPRSAHGPQLPWPLTRGQLDHSAVARGQNASLHKCPQTPAERRERRSSPRA